VEAGIFYQAGLLFEDQEKPVSARRQN